VSVAVGLDELRRKIDEFPTDPYLLSVGDDGRAHSVAVAVRWSGDDLMVPAGNTTMRNATARPLVALLWPPPERGGFSLIVDATVVSTDRADARNEITVRPSRAVLHRPAPSGTGNDCAPVLRSGEGV
jgi:hypothetical protein